MATMVVSTSSSSGSDGSALLKEKGSRNKRKFRADLPISDPEKLPSSSQMECPSFEFSAEKSQNTQTQEKHGVCDFCNLNKDQIHGSKPEVRLSCGLGSFEVGSSRPKEELEAEDFHDADWSDLTENQLEELMLNNLDTIYRSAIKKIAACGYSEEAASKAVLRSGLCYGCKDTVSNIVDNTLAFLRTGQEVDASRDHLFKNLEQLEKYVLAEMVCVLREVRPFFSVGDAMWCLLICDLNMSHACAMDGDSLATFCNDEAQGSVSSLSTLPQLKMEPNSCEPNLFSFQCRHSPQLEPPAATGMPNLPNSRNPLVLEGLPPEKVSQIPSFGNMEKPSGSNSERVTSGHQSSIPEEKPGGARKGHSSTARRESTLRQKSLHLEKSYRAYGSKGTLRTGKVGNLGSLLLDKKQKSISDANSGDPKNASLKFSKGVGVDASPTDGNHNVSTHAGISTPIAFNPKMINIPSSLPAANTELSLSLPSKNDAASRAPSSNLEAPSYSFSAIQYDKMLGQWIPDEKKDEVILKLAPRVRELQNQMQGWTEWANQKVMQAARRLSKDKAELKTLRQEKEEAIRLKKEKQTLEENAMKKLSEMDNALCKAGGQVERANSTVRKLEVDNTELRKQMEEAKLRAAESAASCQEVSKREKKTLKKFQSWEKQKIMFQEDLATEKRKLIQLQQELERAKEFQDQQEARRKQEEKVKEELLMQAKSLKKEREQIKVAAKSKEDMIRLKADKDLKKHKDDIQKLETEISQLRLKTDSSKIAALRWGNDSSYASRVTDGKCAPAVKGTNQTPNISEVVPDFHDFLGGGGLKRERECVMCLTEEMSVVFLPCAHQVVCTKCNELHEKQGMKDCPSCRTPIQCRICVCYARS